LFSAMSASPVEPFRWEKGASRTQLKTRIFEVLGVEYRHGPRERSREFTVIQAPDWVNVVALTSDHQLVLVRQFRFGIDDFSVEVPGGVIEAGEDPVVAGLRELSEETGFSGTQARLLATVHPNPAIQSNRCHLVLVENVRKTHELSWDQDEEIHVSTLPVEEVFTLARNGGITHSLVLNALFMFEPHWRVLRTGGK
jgi:ADP-ribose pyrophosphatase